jgi:hypothetical protein
MGFNKYNCFSIFLVLKEYIICLTSQFQKEVDFYIYIADFQFIRKSKLNTSFNQLLKQDDVPIFIYIQLFFLLRLQLLIIKYVLFVNL